MSKMKVKYPVVAMIAFLTMTATVLADPVFVMANSGRTAFLVNKKWEKDYERPKSKYEKMFEKKYARDGRLLSFKDCAYGSDNNTKYYYGEKKRLIRLKEKDRGTIKFHYSTGGLVVHSGEYIKAFKQFLLYNRYKFTKSGRIKEYGSLDDNEGRTVFKYKKGKLVEVRHYTSTGRLWLKDKAKYNKKGWLTKITNYYRLSYGRGKFKEVSVKMKYKVKEKYVYRYERYLDEDGGYLHYITKFSKKLKNKMKLGIDPYEMPYLPVYEKSVEYGSKTKYKYTFYKRKPMKGLIKTASEYYKSSSRKKAKYRFESAEKFSYKKVRISKKRQRIQHYLTEGVQKAVLVPDETWFSEAESGEEE